MVIYRIARWQYLDDLSGTGARLYGGRWNHEGHAMLYTSSHLSLAVLELLANQVRHLVDESYGYIKLEIPPSATIRKVTPEQLDNNWRRPQYAEQTLQIGTNWLKSGESLALVVPSAVLQQESNVLINPSHPSFDTVEILEKNRLILDGRIAGG